MWRQLVDRNANCNGAEKNLTYTMRLQGERVHSESTRNAPSVFHFLVDQVVVEGDNHIAAITNQVNKPRVSILRHRL